MFCVITLFLIEAETYVLNLKICSLIDTMLACALET